MSGVKAIITGLSCLDDDRIVVFAQAIITNLQEARHSLDVNAFYVDTGAAAFKKKSKKDHRWLKEEVEKARITPGAVITVNGKQRYVRTEPEVVDLAKLLTAQSYFLFCPPFGFASNSSTRPRPHSAYPTGFIDQARRLCSDDQPDPNLTWVACKNVTVCYNQTARRREATLVAVSVVKMEQSGREVATSVQQTITAQLKCKMFQTKVGPQNPGPINLSSALALVNMVYVDVPPPQPRSYAVIESLLVY